MKSTILLFLFILSYNVSAQEMMMEHIPGKDDFVELKTKLKKDDLEQIEVAFLTNDFDLLKPCLYKDLHTTIKQILADIKDSLDGQKLRLITHYEAGFRTYLVPLSSHGTMNVLRYRSTNNKTVHEIEYTYAINDSTLSINSVKFETYGEFQLKSIRYPQILFDFDTATLELSKIDNWNYFNQKIKELKKINKQLLPYKFEFIKPELNPVDLSKSYGSLSWKLIFKKSYANAILSAKEGLQIDPDQRWINTNLALAYLLQNQYKKAESIYKKYLDQIIYHKRTFRSVFIEDLNKAKEAGLENDDFEKIYKLLNQ